MAAKAMSIKMDEGMICELKDVANVFHMTMTDVICEALEQYLSTMKSDPFYRLTANVSEASAEESAEILDAINALSDEDLEISSVSKHSI